MAVREKRYRYAALAVLVLAVARAFFIDMRGLDAMYRILAFAVLGTVLLAVGFGYLKAVDRLKPKASHFVGLLVEVNPLSKATLERIRRWVALPRGAGDVSPGDSLFGSFVGLFVTRVPAADRTVTFRSQNFVPSALPVIKRPVRRARAR